MNLEIFVPVSKRMLYSPSLLFLSKFYISTRISIKFSRHVYGFVVLKKHRLEICFSRKLKCVHDISPNFRTPSNRIEQFIEGDKLKPGVGPPISSSMSPRVIFSDITSAPLTDENDEVIDGYTR